MLRGHVKKDIESLSEIRKTVYLLSIVYFQLIYLAEKSHYLRVDLIKSR